MGRLELRLGSARMLRRRTVDGFGARESYKKQMWSFLGSGDHFNSNYAVTLS